MLNWIIAASFEDVIETDNIGFNVGIWMVDAVADAGLSGKVYDNVWMERLKNSKDFVFIGKVTFHELEVFIFLKFFEAVFF